MEFIQITDGASTLTPSKKSLTRKSIKSETSNPIFNFKQDFIDNLQKITPTELGMSVPFVALRAVDDQGKVLHDFNLELFQKQLDFTKLGTKERFSDRPTASLMELKIKSDQGSGYIYFQDISFTIKVHKPDIALNGILISLLFPGMPMEVEFGWRNSVSKNPLLTKTEKLLFALKTYNFSYSQDGQIDLTIDGTAFSERFNNTLLGDEKIDKDATDDTLRKGGLSSLYNSITSYQDYLQKLKDNPDKSGVRDMDLVEKMFTSYQSTREKIAKETRNNFKNNMAALKNQQQASAEYHEIDNIKQELFTKKHGMVTIHDLVSTMCEKTLIAFQETTRTNTLRFVYGLFHNEIGKNQSKFAGQPLADFPIALAVFREKISEYTEKSGDEVLTLEAFFNLIIREFLHNEGYWRKLESTKDGVRVPHMYLAVNNYRVGSASSSIQMDISLVDINRDIPMTSELIKGTGKLSVGDFEKKLKDKGIPVIKLGHGNGFIRELKMNNVMDEYMKAALIRRMADASPTLTRAFIPIELQNALGGSDVMTPLHLPLQGSATVLGCVDFKPFRSFGLLSGIFVIDGVYKIMSVTHTINNGGFVTNFDILYH